MSLLVSLLPGAVADMETLAAWAGQHSAASRTKLLATVAAKVQSIERNPEMCAALPDHPDIRRCVVTPTVSLYYRIQPTAIEIIAFADTRRDPDSLVLPS